MRVGQEDSAMVMRYAAMRLVQLIPVALVVTMVVFFVMMVVPGDPVMVMLGAVDGAQISREVYAAMRGRLGLDQPLIVQYLTCFRETWVPRLPIGRRCWK
jgi:peptide/nickel transport system permease protein